MGDLIADLDREVGLILDDLGGEVPSRAGEANVVLLPRPAPELVELPQYWSDSEFCLAWADLMEALLGDAEDGELSEVQWAALADAAERVTLAGYRLTETQM
ncbi:hypothetical protein [Phenylobacterium conjunctum]|uniref:Uncharacterized protein n=1 Tax=Phenylobacterium conjunctum TaxID=1298959 RepID=A0ABW3T343_9CAUL